jgi:tetratricopeptide (TPR) repeat protein
VALVLVGFSVAMRVFLFFNLGPECFALPLLLGARCRRAAIRGCGQKRRKERENFLSVFFFFLFVFFKIGSGAYSLHPAGRGAVIVTEAHFDECINPKLIVGGELLMKKAILVAAILIAPSQSSYGADWQYDFRRCTVGHEVGDFYIRISSLYPVEFDIMKNLDKSGVDFKVASVRIDQDDFSARSGYAFEYSLGSGEPLLRALARGNRLRVVAENKAEPIVDMAIGNGKKAVAFLRKCDMYWTNFHIATNAWEKGRASAKVGEYARAIGDFNQAIQKLPKDYTTKRARILFERGQAKLRKGDKTGGNADIRAATKLRRWIATMDDINP